MRTWPSIAWLFAAYISCIPDRAVSGPFDKIFTDSRKSIEKSIEDVGKTIEKGTANSGREIEKGPGASSEDILQQSPTDPCRRNSTLPQCTDLSREDLRQ